MANEHHLQIKETRLLIKFQSEERILQLQAGKIYMKSLQWYRDYEAKSPSIGDVYEAMLHINKADVKVWEMKSNELSDSRQIKDGLFKTENSNDYVFCMFGVRADSHEFAFTDEQKREMFTFGDTALLITNTETFCTRIRNALIMRGVSLADCHCRFVTYYDESVDSFNYWCHLWKGMYNVAFQKRNKYAYQQEYRFLIPNHGRNEDFFELQIGDISDISEIYKTSVILNDRF
jgi:hypothetical protein